MIARRKLTRLIGAAGVAASLVVLFIYRHDLTHLDAETLADRVRASGPMGPLTLIALLIAQAVVAPLPSPPILMAAGFVYGPWWGFGIGWLGTLLGAGCCFGLARAFGRPFAQRFVRPQRLTTVDTHIAARTGTTFMAIVSLRVFMPPLFDAVSYGCGLVRVPVSLFVLATAVGEVPKVGSFTYIGAASGGASTWLSAWILLGPAIGLVGLRIARSRLAGRSAKRGSAASDSSSTAAKS